MIKPADSDDDLSLDLDQDGLTLDDGSDDSADAEVSGSGLGDFDPDHPDDLATALDSGLDLDEDSGVNLDNELDEPDDEINAMLAGSAERDLSPGATSGINLSSTNSGLSQEEEPLDLGSNEPVEPLELPEDEDLIELEEEVREPFVSKSRRNQTTSSRKNYTSGGFELLAQAEQAADQIGRDIDPQLQSPEPDPPPVLAPVEQPAPPVDPPATAAPKGRFPWKRFLLAIVVAAALGVFGERFVEPAKTGITWLGYGHLLPTEESGPATSSPERKQVTPKEARELLVKGRGTLRDVEVMGDLDCTGFGFWFDLQDRSHDAKVRQYGKDYVDGPLAKIKHERRGITLRNVKVNGMLLALGIVPSKLDVVHPSNEITGGIRLW